MKLKRCNWCGKILWPWQTVKWLPMHRFCAELVSCLENMGCSDLIFKHSYIHKKLQEEQNESARS